VTRRRFERIVEDVLQALPLEFRRALENVQVVVEEWPTPEQVRSVGLGEDDLLFGLYEGTPLPERGVDPPLLPDRITVFMGPLLEACQTEAELREEIRKTVLHELAHYFGFGEEELARLGYG